MVRADCGVQSLHLALHLVGRFLDETFWF